uniref:Plant intracellular Ras-group-related LRR protein 3 n=1 Tax=Ananas comosus var. bracteatus TaxID=296719 RepID=A0A6V7NNM2_ANACO|nr:unnamed protein product [Ananas comosus var. bracteatus]
MSAAVAEVAQVRAVLRTLGDRPDHEAVDAARARIAEAEAAPRLDEERTRARRAPRGRSGSWWVARRGAARGHACGVRGAAEGRRGAARHDLPRRGRGQERRGRRSRARRRSGGEEEQVNEEVVGILQGAVGKCVERVDLSDRQLRHLPEAFGKLRGLVYLNVSNNQLEDIFALTLETMKISFACSGTLLRNASIVGFMLIILCGSTFSRIKEFEQGCHQVKVNVRSVYFLSVSSPLELCLRLPNILHFSKIWKVIPDAIGGLDCLEELRLSSNLLVSLPDSIGLLSNLKILDVSGNRLKSLPDSISKCRSLVELDASYNDLTYLPTNIGYELANLQKLCVHLNKLRSLPTSVCEMSNFSDLQELPTTFGDLISLRELDLSNNQIHALPDTFGLLEKLEKLNLDQNPLAIPPMDVVNNGLGAVMEYMKRRWAEILLENEQRSMAEENAQSPAGWLTRSTSWLNNFVTDVSGSLSGYLGAGGEKPLRIHILISSCELFIDVALLAL